MHLISPIFLAERTLSEVTYVVKGAESDFCVRVVPHPCVEGHAPSCVLRKKP